MGSTPLDELAAAIQLVLERPASATERQQFEKYVDTLLRWNRTHRLTGLTTGAAVVRKLFQDSLLFLPLLPPRPVRLADIGTGGGIPGIPIRIVDDRVSLTLIEARRKKTSFLHALVRELKLLDVRVLHGRAEELLAEIPDLQASFDAVVMRAAGPIPDMLSAVMGYLRPGGVLIAGGPPSSRSLPAHAGKDWEWKRLDLPRLGSRNFVLARKPLDF